MCDKQTIKYFFSGFLSVFSFGVTKVKYSKVRDVPYYITVACDYINDAYKKL